MVDISNSTSTSQVQATQPASLTSIVPPKWSTPQPVSQVTQPVAKEVKQTMAEDPLKMFDWSNCKTHIVKAGETLYDIAQANHVALQQLRYFNHVNKATLAIRTGQTIYIPNGPVPVPAGK